ncbi:NAD-dependent epimerase/dehydratase family protein [Methylobacterium sp. 092160098-2]|uniref:NAD-dependent epimerase/dehydratase family protein n=1 Tax=Methylobacterium sp. 092160098-2 TaxID=3025129 RepID=UPI002381C1C5|nr:NAD-dependent epimerase/dehydratase family protein [Methylobacterium sp. 092160098-2]MDE4915346.1 NAD-dependent epimerase/dehydratase family protein [Methylobacterium sp. 092160098-2]
MSASSPSDKTELLNGLRCLVLGGGGFIGANLCARLAEVGAEVTSFGRSLGFNAGNSKIKSITGSFNDRIALSNALEGQEIVFHLISGSVPESSNRDPAAELKSSPLSTIHMLDLCVSSGVKKLIFASSGGAIYGIPSSVPICENDRTDPISAYGISKLLIEKYLFLYRHLHGLNYHSLRIANPYGRYQLGHKRQGLVGTFVHRALAGLPVEIWGDGEITRDFIHVDDVIEAFVEVVTYDGPHRIMNVGSSRGLSVNNILYDIEALLGQGSLKRVYTPGRAADVPVNVLDTSLIKSELGWTPKVEWPDGLKDTFNWMSENDGLARGRAS